MGTDARSVWLQSIVVLCVAGFALAVVTRLTSRQPGKRLTPPRRRGRSACRDLSDPESCGCQVNALLFEAMDGADFLRTKIVGKFARPRQR